MRLLVCVTMLFLQTLVHSQSINKRYNSHIGKDGYVFFFNPTKVPTDKNNDVREFFYDMTYNITSDSLTLNFTIVSKSKIDEPIVSFCSGITHVAFNAVKMLYVEKHKKNYISRFTSKVSFTDIVPVFHSPLPLVIKIDFDENNLTARYGKKKWEKETRVMNEIFELIEIQK